MRVQIENCNVVDTGAIEIESNKLNIKYEESFKSKRF